jgi:hypothetical protein
MLQCGITVAGKRALRPYKKAAARSCCFAQMRLPATGKSGGKSKEKKPVRKNRLFEMRA